MSKPTIVQSNEFIKVKGNELSANEKRIFFTLVSKVNNMHDKGFNDYVLPLKEICKEWGLEEHNSYNRIVEAMDSLSEKSLKVITMENGKQKWTSISYIEKLSYVRGSGVIEVRLHDSIKPYLLNFSKEKPFTKFEYEMLRNLSSNGMRMYELLKCWEGIKVWTATIKQLRELFSLENKYRDTDAIEKKVIKPCIKEINKYTDISIEYSSSGRGETKKYAFTIRKRDDRKIDLEIPRERNEIPEEEKLFERLWKKYPNKKGKAKVTLEAKKELLKHDEQELERAIERYKKEIDIDNPKYIKHGHTFFNGDIFDYMDENFEGLPKRFDMSNPDNYTEEDANWL